MYISLSHLDSDSAQVWKAFVASSPCVTLDCGWNWNCALIFLALPRCKCVAQFAATATVAQCHNLGSIAPFVIRLPSLSLFLELPMNHTRGEQHVIDIEDLCSALANLVSSQQRWYHSKSVIPRVIRLYLVYTIILYHLKVQISQISSVNSHSHCPVRYEYTKNIALNFCEYIAGECRQFPQQERQPILINNILKIFKFHEILVYRCQSSSAAASQWSNL